MQTGPPRSNSTTTHLFGNTAAHGELTLLVLLDAGGERLTDASLAAFQADAAEGFDPSYTYSDEASSTARALVGSLVFLAAALLVGLVLYRRRTGDAHGGGCRGLCVHR